MRDGPRKPTCISCPHNYTYHEFTPMRKMGVMMHLGDQFCTGGKKARRFKRSGVKHYTPDWCPKRKTPCELRVYTFKSAGDWLMYMMLDRDLGGKVSCLGRRYALAHELRTNLTPRNFWERCDLETSVDLLSVEVNFHDIVEIDDGLNPVFFHKTETGYEMLSSFDAATARKNKKED